MGIVAFCPHGHRVNVKDSYSGRKVFCPTCGAKLRVPTAATGPVPHATPQLPTARLLDMAADVVATLPRVLPFEPAPPEPQPAFAPSPQPPAAHPR